MTIPIKTYKLNENLTLHLRPHDGVPRDEELGIPTPHWDDIMLGRYPFGFTFWAEISKKIDKYQLTTTVGPHNAPTLSMTGRNRKIRFVVEYVYRQQRLLNRTIQVEPKPPVLILHNSPTYDFRDVSVVEVTTYE